LTKKWKLGKLGKKKCTMPESIEIVFIEYKLSSLPHCKSPIRKLKSSPRYIISMDKDLAKNIQNCTEQFELMYLTEGIIARQYGHLKGNNFPKMCKLHFLQKLKLVEKPIVVFTSLDIIDQLGAEFISESENGFIRKIQCIAYLNEDHCFETYYATFNNDNCSTGGLNSLTFENIALLSTTALM
jgi:hypothetical protein